MGDDVISEMAHDQIKNLRLAGRTIHVEHYPVPATGDLSWDATKAAGHRRNDRMLLGQQRTDTSGSFGPDDPRSKEVPADSLWAFHLDTEPYVQAADATLKMPGVVTSGNKLNNVLNPPRGSERSFAATVRRIAEITFDREGVARVPKAGDTLALRVAPEGQGTDFVRDPTAQVTGSPIEEGPPDPRSAPYIATPRGMSPGCHCEGD